MVKTRSQRSTGKIQYESENDQAIQDATDGTASMIDPPSSIGNLAAQVSSLTHKMETIIEWIAFQAKATSREWDDSTSITRQDIFDHEKEKKIKEISQSFRIEAKIEIRTFDGSINAKKLDAWIDQVETYFDLYGYSIEVKVSFVRLKLSYHTLVWWNTCLKVYSLKKMT